VILGEALLVTFDPAARLRRRLCRWTGFSAIGVVTLVLCLLLWHEQAANSAAIARDQTAIDTYRQTLSRVPLDLVADDDLPHILPVLNAAAALPRPGKVAPRGVGSMFGLGQGAKLVETDRLAYQHALEQIFLPRLIWRLESQMRSHLDQPVFLYEATRVYLMLGNDGPLDPGLVMDWMQLDWSVHYPGPDMQPVRDALMRHLTALLASPLPSVPLDGALVREARSAFSRMSPAERVYSRIRPTASPADVPAWSPATALGGAEASQLFVRVSGRPLTDSIPGFYTALGFRAVLLPALAPAAKQVSDESWVLGPQTNADVQPTGEQAVQSIEQGVIALYAKDYEQRWDSVLNDIGLAPFHDHMDTVQKLYVMASPQSPMRDLLVSIVHQLTPAHAAVLATVQTAKAKPDAQASRLSAIFVPAATAAPAPLGHEIDDHYQPLVDFTGPTGQAGPISDIFRLLNQLQSELSQLPNSASPSGVLQNSQDPAQLLLAEADRQPQPVARWLRQIAVGGTTTLAVDAHQAAATAFVSMDGPSKLCHAVVDGHYPFNPRARSEAPLASFTKLFAPGGVLDSYFKTQLQPYVNTSDSVWHAQGVGGVAPPITDAQILPFQQAVLIRALYFPTGGDFPSMHFTIKPVSIDPLSTKVVLSLGSSDVAWQANDAAETSVTWPLDGLDRVSLTYTPPTVTPPLIAQGPWALFRLFSEARLERGNGPTHFFATFRSGTRQATFAIETDSALTPLYRHVLETFQCPLVQ
jgi:type VI secretion system protein ImpL